MATYSLKKSYQLKNLREINFKDLWGDHGVFTTMWIFGKPAKILFLENHLKNLIKSLKSYGITKKTLKKDIIKILNINLSKGKKYDHLLRVALNKQIISISLRKRVKPKKDFNLKLVNLRREKPQYKNLKYKKILSHLVKLDNSRSDIGLVVNNKILETGTSNLLFVKKNKIYSPISGFYKGTTLKFFIKRIKIIKSNIMLNSLNQYDEIIVLGSGKGVTSVDTIKNTKWKRKSFKCYRILSKIYQQAIMKCPRYNG